MDKINHPISIHQRAYLRKRIEECAGVREGFNTEDLFSKLEGVSHRQYSYLMHFASPTDIHKFLMQKGIPAKTVYQANYDALN